MGNYIIPNLVIELIDAGLEVTISKNSDLGIYFDLHLDAKSHMYLYHDGGDLWRVSMRYNEDYAVDSIEDLFYLARHGMHGRDYINHVWARLIGLTT